jgi:TolA-binding protein
MIGVASTMRFRVSTVLGFVAVLSSGCWVTTSEHDRVKGELERRIVSMETNDVQRREQLQAAVDQATAQVRTLNEQLEQARTQTRNLADLGVRIDGLEERLRTVNGSLDEINHANDQNTQARTAMENRVVTIERRVGIAPQVDPSQIPADNAQLVAQARQAFEAREYTRARFLTGTLLQRAPTDPNADDALLLQGRCLIAENRAATAVQDLNRLMQTYPSSDLIPDTLAVIAEAYVGLRMCTYAQRSLRLLVERHGSTTAGRAARARLEQVRSLPREACGG